MTEGLRSFVFNSQAKNISAKDKYRTELIDRIIKDYHHYQTLEVLNLSSAWWRFENELIKRINKLEVKPKLRFTSCEKDWNIFTLTAMNIPRSSKYTLKSFWNDKFDCQYVKSNVAKVLHTDILNFINKTESKKDIIWLDFVSPCNAVAKEIKQVKNILNPNGLVVITLLKARDKFHSTEERIKYVSKLCKLNLVEVIEYKDTTPMLKLIYKN